MKNGSDWSWWGATYLKCDKLPALVTFPPTRSDLTFQRVFLCLQGLWKIMTAILNQKSAMPASKWVTRPMVHCLSGLPISAVIRFSKSIISKAVVRKTNKQEPALMCDSWEMKNQYIKLIQLQFDAIWRYFFAKVWAFVWPRQTCGSITYIISSSEF